MSNKILCENQNIETFSTLIYWACNSDVEIMGAFSIMVQKVFVLAAFFGLICHLDLVGLIINGDSRSFISCRFDKKMLTFLWTTFEGACLCYMLHVGHKEQFIDEIKSVSEPVLIIFAMILCRYLLPLSMIVTIHYALLYSEYGSENFGTF